MSKLKTKTNWLRAGVQSVTREVGVDRENKIIKGFIVAEEGPFHSEGRGEFNLDSLSSIVRLMRAEPMGLKSRFTHPTLSDDGLGKFLGRARNARLATINRDGKESSLIRADLHLSATAFEDNPNGNLGDYILGLASEDPDAMSASLVLTADEEFRTDARNRRLMDAEGNELPPLWRPTSLHAVDMVDTGEATHAFLSTDNLPDEIVRRGSELLDRQFQGCGRDVVEARCGAWLTKYLDLRYGPAEVEKVISKSDPRLVAAKLRNEKLKARLRIAMRG